MQLHKWLKEDLGEIEQGSVLVEEVRGTETGGKGTG